MSGADSKNASRCRRCTCRGSLPHRPPVGIQLRDLPFGGPLLATQVDARARVLQLQVVQQGTQHPTLGSKMHP